MSTKFESENPTGERGRRITILSIDGGGVRGIIPATILEELETCLQVWLQLWDIGSLGELVHHCVTQSVEERRGEEGNSLVEVAVADLALLISFSGCIVGTTDSLCI